MVKSKDKVKIKKSKIKNQKKSFKAVNAFTDRTTFLILTFVLVKP